MQAGTIVKLKTPTFGVLAKNGHREAVTIPSDAVLTILSRAEGDPMIGVCWDEKNVSMFEIDLRERGEIVKAAASHTR